MDEHGRPLRADEIEQKVFYTAYPEYADREQYGAPLIVVRLDPSELDLPPERQGWAPRGIVAYSKICTHAGCAISLYRVPTFAPVQPKPALVCPCHYSTFDPANGGGVLFGPAEGRCRSCRCASIRAASSARPATSQAQSALHVFIFPILIGTLLLLHLLLVAMRHHTQFRSRRASNRTVVGIPPFPGYAPRSLGLMFAVFGVLFLLGGLVQINPIWLWGPYHVGDSTNGAQPDWYLGWLIGALRLVRGFDLTIGDYTLVPNPFWGGVAFPLAVFAILFLWPWIERRATGDYGFQNVLDRPRDAPWRTAIGAALLMWVFVIFVAGAADRIYVSFGVRYETLVWVFRVLAVVLPLVVLAVTHRVCIELQRGDDVKLRQRAALARSP